MSTIRSLLAAALACGFVLQAQAQNGVVAAASAPLPAAVAARTAASAPAPRAQRRGTLANSASRQLNTADVSSRANPPPPDLKAQADADLARRDARPRLKVERENLKGDEAARAIAQQHNAATYDRDISRGDKDHTEQAAGLKVYIKK